MLPILPYRAYDRPLPEKYPFCWDAEVVDNLDETAWSCGSSLHFNTSLSTDVTLQLVPSTETLLF